MIAGYKLTVMPMAEGKGEGERCEEQCNDHGGSDWAAEVRRFIILVAWLL